MAAQAGPKKAQIAITFDLEMSRNFPTWDQLEWDYEKGNLDEATKVYALRAARRVRERGGVMHFFVVGRVLEQKDVGWLREIIAMGHSVGNHTYDHAMCWPRDWIRFNRDSCALHGCCVGMSRSISCARTFV